MDAEGEEDCLMMMWPITIVHPIDEERYYSREENKNHYLAFSRHNPPNDLIVKIVCPSRTYNTWAGTTISLS